MKMSVWIGAVDDVEGFSRLLVHFVSTPLGSAQTPSLRQRGVHVFILREL